MLPTILVSNVLLINQSIVIGFSKNTCKSNVLFFLEEILMFNQKKCQIHIPQLFNLRFNYFCTCNFIIHGVIKQKNVNDTNFSLHTDKFGEFLKQYHFFFPSFFIFICCSHDLFVFFSLHFANHYCIDVLVYVYEFTHGSSKNWKLSMKSTIFWMIIVLW